ncbi:hypothetical protein CJU90_2796 [Yarrowia sp. C11]|nr:hypothetical protein CKK34_4244 [Yarrowia sp. E02]KAG5369345.1 hypothetical protein CJU90_2796 [Yarrowia sp. C11]
MASDQTIPQPDAAQLVHQILLQIRAAILEYQNLEALGDRYNDKIEVVTKPKSDLLFLLAPLVRTKLSFGLSSSSSSKRRASFQSEVDHGDVPGDYVDTFPPWMEDLTWGVSSESDETDIITRVVRVARQFRFSLVQHGYARLDAESLYARCLVQNLGNDEQIEIRFVWVPEEKKWLLHDFLPAPRGGERTMGYTTVAEAEERFSPAQSVPSPPQSTHNRGDQTLKSPNLSSSSDDDYWGMYGQQQDDEEDGGDAMDMDDLSAFTDQATIRGVASPKPEQDTKTVTGGDNAVADEDDYYAAYDRVETAVGGDEPQVEDTPTEAHVIESIRSLKKLCESSGISQARFAELVKRGLTED